MAQLDDENEFPVERHARRTTAEAVGAHIQELIRRGAWTPGERVPSIRTLAARYNVSVMTMTRVVRKLADQGVLRTESRKGVYVAEISRPSEPRPGIGTAIQRSLMRTFPRPRSLSVALHAPSVIDTINLASGTMSPSAVPQAALNEAIRTVSMSYAEQSFSTIAMDGDVRLREWVATYLADFGIEVGANDVIITNGSQQGRKLVAEALIEPGDTVLVEQPAYPFALSTFEGAGARCIGVPVDPQEGLRLDVLEHLVERHRPKLIYTVSTGQIPTGLTMSLEQRRRLVQLAAQKGFLIVESDAGNELYYEGHAPNAIKSLDPGGLVVYLKSFSRVVAAGLRVGATIVDGPLRDAIVARKLNDDMVTSTLAQDVFLAYVTRKDFRDNLEATKSYYLARRDVTLRALATTMPEGITWSVPTAGLHTWLTLPDGVSSRMIAERAIHHGVVVAHSEIFMPNDNPDNGIRVTFSDTEPDRIALGVERLAVTLRTALANSHEWRPQEVLVKVL